MHRLFLVIGVLSIGLYYSHGVMAQTITKPPQTENTSTDPIGNARKFYQLGLNLMEAGQLSQAVGTFRQALQLDPEYAEAYAALGRTYFKLREWQQASDNLKRAAVLNYNHKQRDARKVAAVDTPAPLNVSKRVSLRGINAEIISSNEITAATINLRQLLPQAPEPLKEKPAQTQSVASGTAVANENAAQPAPEQTALNARVSDPVTPTAPVNETNVAKTIPAARTEETSLTKIYRVGPNDVLDIHLNDVAGQQSTLYTVTAAGLLEHPLLSEPMSVAGLTVEEISTRIDADLQKRAIIEDAKALVAVRDYASHTVLVSGLVKDSGTKVLRREAIPLYVVIADAQPLPEAAKVTVVRGGDSNKIYEIDLSQAADMNFLVRSGDVITLRPGPVQFIYIGGEIKFPGEKTFRRGLTLMQVILASGGVGPKAKVAEIARSNENGFLVPTRFELKDIASGKAIDPVLKPGDRISILR